MIQPKTREFRKSYSGRSISRGVVARKNTAPTNWCRVSRGLVWCGASLTSSLACPADPSGLLTNLSLGNSRPSPELTNLIRRFMQPCGFSCSQGSSGDGSKTVWTKISVVALLAFLQCSAAVYHSPLGCLVIPFERHSGLNYAVDNITSRLGSTIPIGYTSCTRRL
ncbi:uncharacterized protein GGS22DRAFT_32413 [Annulohypoxylon maeteangense]|uniref:uncharacterized protein n=1 Tax=Annulohypoxylon maeteangense TaxID=1927788 RepID=UPI002008C527|nr:uncharacterized protein GGS22DRAFT_32413 [Annulohypoxylon maeteangense]KAI0883523.1 hypothetical protein GGS22DRAFT_32413 [Annulohypoxylon maeteangense]